MSDIKNSNIPSMSIGMIVSRLANAYCTIINKGLPMKKSTPSETL